MQNLRLGKARLSVCAPSLKSHPRFRTPGLACASDTDGAAGMDLMNGAIICVVASYAAQHS